MIHNFFLMYKPWIRTGSGSGSELKNSGSGSREPNQSGSGSISVLKARQLFIQSS